MSPPVEGPEGLAPADPAAMPGGSARPPGLDGPEPGRVAAWVATLGAAVVALDLALRGDGSAFLDAPLLVFAACLLLAAAGLIGAGRLVARYGLVGRVERRADRGDLDGAIAQLRAALDRGAIAPGPAADTFDPWAPPAPGGLADPGRAARFDLLGTLHARRGDWPAALAAYRRAGGAGGGAPAHRVRGAEARVMLGRVAEGLPLALGAIAAVPAHDDLGRYALNLALGRTLIAAGHPAEAAGVLDAADAALARALAVRVADRARLAAEVASARARLADAPDPRPLAPASEAPR